MAAACSSSTRNLSQMRLRERTEGLRRKAELAERAVRAGFGPWNQATSAPAEVAPKHSDFAPG